MFHNNFASRRNGIEFENKFILSLILGTFIEMLKSLIIYKARNGSLLSFFVFIFL